MTRVPVAFDSLPLSTDLLEVVAGLGYTQPTAIQTASIPALIAGRDLIGQSKTGSGKTAAFALAILQRLDVDNRSLQALVVCPTRELAAQVAREFRALGRRYSGLVVLELVGGQVAKPQREALRRGVHIAVGTPGRLLDHLCTGSLDTGALATCVLDEADRMLDMGFGPDVEEIVLRLPRPRQTVLFSATFPDAIEAMSAALQQDAVRVTVAEPDGVAAEIRQLQLVVEPDDKLHALCWALHEFPHDTALVFCNFKATVTRLTRSLAAAGISADRLDGDLDQFQRNQVLARFRNHSIRVLIATDVAGRGIDIEGLDLVINFEIPEQPETYVHRIGRTGRAGRTGVAVSLTTRGRELRMRAIEARHGAAVEVLDWRACDEPGDEPGADALLRTLAVDAAMETIRISGGRKDKVRAGDILGALTGDAGGLQGSDVGKIEVHARLSYVAVARGTGRSAAKRLNAGRIRGRRYRATLIGDAEADAGTKRESW